jgi:hypothetical protein
MENMDRLRRTFTLDKKCLAYNAIVNNEAKNDQKIRTERFLFFLIFHFPFEQFGLKITENFEVSFNAKLN